MPLCGEEECTSHGRGGGQCVPPFGMFIIKLPVVYRVVMVWCMLACRCNKKFTRVLTEEMIQMLGICGIFLSSTLWKSLSSETRILMPAAVR